MNSFRRRQDSYRWHWSERCSNYPTEIDVLIDRTEPEYGVFCKECEEKEKRTAMSAFRRRQDSYRWHWSERCSNYPTEIDVLINHAEPEYGIFCEECGQNNH